jgi:hypothetical protein
MGCGQLASEERSLSALKGCGASLREDKPLIPWPKNANDLRHGINDTWNVYQTAFKVLVQKYKYCRTRR